MTTRPQHRLAIIEFFVAGVCLTVAVGYAFEGSFSGAIITLAASAVLIGHAVAQRGVASSWLVALGFFASLNKLDLTAQRAFGDLRGPVIIGGSAVALLIGVLGVLAERRRTVRVRHPAQQSPAER